MSDRSPSIISATNPKIKRVRRLLQDGRYRRRERQFVVEGSRWIKELATQKVLPNFWLATESWLAAHQELADALTALGRAPLPIDEALLPLLSNTETPSGVTAVLHAPDQPWPPKPSLLLIFDGVKDPGNAGTILRTAAAAGVDGVLIGPGTVDLTNPKVVRSTMGAILRLPQRRLDWAKLEDALHGCRPVGADAAGSLNYDLYNWREPTALIIGSEAHGLSAAARDAAATTLSIPMADTNESLNAAAAAAIMLFEGVRQRNSVLQPAQGSDMRK